VAVTNALCAYIKTKNLQNQANKRQILPDAELTELLGYTDKVAETPLTYFYIQQLIQKHFVKQVKA
jgi:chromatin remodeling complex protein RSC6